MMVANVEKVTKNIDALTSANYQVHHDRQIEQKKGMLDLNTSYAFLAQNKILTYQLKR